jgi:ATP-dependent DNA ligase
MMQRPVLGLCKTATAMPRDLDNWWMEPKLDGVRVQVTVDGQTVTFRNRAGVIYDGQFPIIAKALTGLSLVLDGEMVWYHPQTGEVDFHKGSALIRSNPTESVRRQTAEGWVTFTAFDFTGLGTHDIRHEPIEMRRAMVTELVTSIDCPLVRTVEQAPATTEQQAAYVERYREGVVLKRKRSTYPNGRSGSWLKLKETADEDVVMMGGNRGEGKYAETLGAIVFGQYRDGVLTRRGTCSGMTDATRDLLWADLDSYVGRVLTIRHMGALLDTEGGFRFPQFQSFRDDKLPTDCTWS